MSPKNPQKRGERVAPPAVAPEWELRFGTSDAAGGWEELCSHAPGPTKTCWEQLRADPYRRDSRQHPLHDRLATRDIGGQTLHQWQYEVTGAGRVWYCPDDRTHTVWLTLAEPGHPKESERRH